jgi:hypothetical protein
MPLQGETPVRPPDLLLARLGLQPQDGVVIAIATRAIHHVQDTRAVAGALLLQRA